MISIPEELLEQVERGNVLLFIGERIFCDDEGRAVIDQLTARLLDRAGITPAERYTFPEAAQVYQDAQGPHALVQFVRDQFESLGDEPQHVHRLIVGLAQCKVLATTCFDRRLEQAFEAAGRPLNPIVGNVDVAFEDERKAQLYKLRGSIEQVQSLVLTEDDYETFFEDRANISIVLQGYLARKTILFVGYDLADPHFKRLYRKVTAPLDDYARPAYAFGEGLPAKTRRWCQRYSIHVIETDVTAFLERLTEELADRAGPAPEAPARPAEAPAAPLPEYPYKLLDYYEPRDAAIFFGRQRETQALTSLIHGHRLVLLYGASGTGKTSLLLAGAVPRLENVEPPYEIIYARALEDPTNVIRRTVRRRFSVVNPSAGGSLVDFLNAATAALGRTLVIVLDQFEEFFIRLSPDIRADFIAELGALYDARDVPAKVVLSLREDWLASVSEIEARIPEVFVNKRRLLPLTRRQARQAITAPVERLGMRYAPALVDQLLVDLMGEPTGSRSAVVMPPQLQLVCSALYERARAEGRETITPADYQALGKTRGVLQQYLNDELARLAPDERMLAHGLLEELVTSQGTKTVKAAGELARAMDVTVPEVAPVLEKLVRARLLRVLDRETAGPAYELAHEYLIREIELSPEAQSRKAVTELIRQELETWHRFGSLLSIERLRLVDEVRERLRLGSEELELLFRSALAAGHAAPYWAARARATGVDVNAIALDGLQSDNFRARAAAATELGRLGDPQFVQSLTEMLADVYTQVRAAAIHALEVLDPSGAWREDLEYECFVPAGEFIMGDDNGEYDDEKPAHPVYLDAFYIGRYPVTNADYKRYMDDIGRAFSIPDGKSDHPVTSVSWYDARDYAAWSGMRLLTEAEWEKAASWAEEQGSGGAEVRRSRGAREQGSRGDAGHFQGIWERLSGREEKALTGRKRRYPWGDEFDASKCNTSESGRHDTTPVGKYSPEGDSPYGVADMAGNVWEWTSSLYEDYPYRADDGREDLSSSDRRVLRGGSFGDGQNLARAAYRDGLNPDDRVIDGGFRVGLGVAAPSSPPLDSEPSAL